MLEKVEEKRQTKVKKLYYEQQLSIHQSDSKK